MQQTIKQTTIQEAGIGDDPTMSYYIGKEGDSSVNKDMTTLVYTNL
jgi:hypothetical protein